MVSVKDIKESFLHLLFPHFCAGCESDVLQPPGQLCMRCTGSLPETNFEMHADNPAEKLFWGRIPVKAASASFYFTKESLMQRLLHLFKYRGNKMLGLQLGIMMGEQLKKSGRFTPDCMIPLPLFPAKEKRRGYNQAMVLCKGIQEKVHIPVYPDVIIRTKATQTQTKKGRIERWENVEGNFALINPDKIRGKHILLVDDVATTGATLEAGATALLQAENVTISIATLCISSR